MILSRKRERKKKREGRRKEERERGKKGREKGRKKETVNSVTGYDFYSSLKSTKMTK